jgi:branched-chain amino acid transport system substrate-binding protein
MRGIVPLMAIVAMLLSGPVGAQKADGVLRIGLSSDMDGVFADSAGKGSVAAAQMAIEDAGGTVLGRTVELVSANDQNKPDIGSGIVRKWFDVDGVEAVVAGGNSSVALAVQDVARQRGKVVLLAGPGSSDLTGKACAPLSTHWAFDSYSTATTTGLFLSKRSPGSSWYFLTADYAFGAALERDTTRVALANGGKLVGGVKVPLNTPDLSSFLLQAKSSGATTIALALAGADLTNAIKQANEFRIAEGGQNLAAMLAFISDVHAMGLSTAQGIITSESFYWDLNDRTREWTSRFSAKLPGKVPNMIHAATYSAVLHYLRGVAAAGTSDASAVVAWMRRTPVNDFNNRDVQIRQDGRVLHAMHVFRVKSPAEKRYQFDYYDVIGTLPGESVFRPMAEGGCPLVAE